MNFFKRYNLPGFILCFFVIVVPSCNLINSDEKVSGNIENVYDGIYLQGIEDSWFVPCVISDESWRPLFNEASFEPIWKILTESQSFKLFIRARGIPSEKGKYNGFFTRYDREFEILEIVEAHQTDTGKCH